MWWPRSTHAHSTASTTPIDEYSEVVNKGKREDKEAVWSLRKIYRASLGLGHRRNSEGFSELLTSSGCFLLREVRRGGQSLSWASHCVLGAPVSPAMRWWSWWDGGRGHSKSDQPKTLPPLISSWRHALTTKVYFIPVSKETLPVYLFECSLKPNLCLTAHDLLNFHLFLSLFFPSLMKFQQSESAIAFKTLFKCWNYTLIVLNIF